MKNVGMEHRTGMDKMGMSKTLPMCYTLTFKDGQSIQLPPEVNDFKYGKDDGAYYFYIITRTLQEFDTGVVFKGTILREVEEVAFYACYTDVKSIIVESKKDAAGTPAK